MNEAMVKEWMLGQMSLNGELLNRTEELAKAVLLDRKIIKKLKRRNFVMGLILGTCGYSLACVVSEQSKKIDALTAEIAELRKEELAQEGE